MLRSSCQSCIRIDWDEFDEPARSAGRERIEAILSCDFDLTWYPIPHPLDGIEPPWWRGTLKAARVLALSLGLFALGAVPIYWEIRYNPLKARPIVLMAFVLWICPLFAWCFVCAYRESKINPAWRRRRVKTPVAEL